MFILGIETTCDETAAAVIYNNKYIKSNIIASQVDYHALHGGVVPELASRLHLERLPYVVDDAINQAGIEFKQLDGIAIARNPGLQPALTTGYAYASGLSLGLGVPLYEIDHLSAHINANFLVGCGQLEEDVDRLLNKDYIALLVSGGHTKLIHYDSKSNKSTSIGGTVDDAAGECFDKVARVLHFPYPGGKKLSEAATKGDRHRYDFPRSKIKEDNFDFSFSGLKTNVIRCIEKADIEKDVFDIAASFEEALVDVLAFKTENAMVKYNSELLLIAGGVASNSYLRKKLLEMTNRIGADFHCPPHILCTDNAAMIGYLPKL